MMPDGYTMIVYGGSPEPVYEPRSVVLLDTRTWQWRPVACEGPGTLSYILGMSIMDKVRQRLILFGGANGDMSIRYLDVVNWRWHVAEEQETPMPEGRERASVVLCGPDSAIVVAGGSLETGAPMDDVWKLRLDTLEWCVASQLSAGKPVTPFSLPPPPPHKQCFACLPCTLLHSTQPTQHYSLSSVGCYRICL